MSEKPTILPYYHPESVDTIEAYFQNNEKNLPETPFLLEPATTIPNMKKFIDSHIALLRGHKDTPDAKQCFLRLQKLKNHIEKQKNN